MASTEPAEGRAAYPSGAGSARPAPAVTEAPLMRPEQVAEMSARIDVLTRTVQFLLAERLNEQKEETREQVIAMLQNSLSESYLRDTAFPPRSFQLQSSMALYTVITARRMMNGVRVMLGMPELDGSEKRAQPA